MELSTILGAVGVTGILAAYLLNVMKKLDREDSLYLWLNAVGAALACASSVMIGSVPFTILEGTWVVVSLVGLWKKA
ncbi:MAG: hypothetical protein NWR72_07625 [Bacteroidia bacterium]|nr:hypothetical protein [Bacteroidia bacterium]